MKTKLFFIFLTFILFSTVYLPLSVAQDYTTWHLPEGAKARLGKGTIEDIQFSPDKKLLAVASSIGVWIYDVDTDEALTQLTGNTFEGFHTFEESVLLTGHTGIVTSIAFSPDGSLLASGSLDNTIHLWNVSNFMLHLTITEHTGEVNDVAFSPDGLMLASASTDKTVGIWSPSTGEKKMRFMDHTDAVTSVAFSPDGWTLASGSADKTIRLWDTLTGEHQQTLTGHTDKVTSVAFNPDVSIDSDGKTLASGSWDKTIRLWDISTGDLKHTLTDSGTPTDIGIVIPMQEVNSVSFRSDGYVLASGSRDGMPRLWATLTGELKQRVTNWEAWFAVNSMCFSPDGLALVSGYEDGTLTSHEVLPTLKHKIGGYSSGFGSNVSFSPDGSMYASTTDWTSEGYNPRPLDRTIRLWDISTGTLKQTFMTENSGWILDISFLPDGETLASIGREEVLNEKGAFYGFSSPTLRLWDISTGRLKRQIRVVDQISVPESETDLRPGTFSPDGLTFTVKGYEYSTQEPHRQQTRIYLFNTSTGRLKQTFIFPIGIVPSTNLAFSPDSKTLAVGLWDNPTIYLWNVETGQLKQVIRGNMGLYPRILAFSPEGRILVSTFYTGRVDNAGISLWKTDTGEHLDTITATIGSNPAPVQLWTFIPDGKILSPVGNHYTAHKNNLRFIPFRGQNYIPASPAFTLPIQPAPLLHLSGGKLEESDTDFWLLDGYLSPDGVTLVAPAAEQGSGHVHYLADLSTVNENHGKQTIPGHIGRISNLSFSPDGLTLASATFKHIPLWDVETISRKDTLEFANALSAAFTPDGETLASGGWNAVKLWSVSAGEQRQTLTGHTGSVRSVALSPNGSTLASGGDDKVVRLWNMKNDTLQDTLTGHTDAVTSVAFSGFHHDGFTLASGSNDKTVRLWNGITGEHLHTLEGHADRVSSVAFDPVSTGIRTVASGSWDSTIRLWDVFSGTHKHTLSGHNGPVTSIAFNSDGETLASGGADTTIHLWDPNFGTLKRILTGHTSGVTSLAFSPDGWTLASGSYDGTVLLWDLTPKTSKAADPIADINDDGVVNIQDLVLVASNLGKTGENPADVNDDGVVNIQDLVQVAGELGKAAAAPSIWRDNFAFTLTKAEVEQWLTQAQQLNHTDATSQRGIRFLEQLLLALTPQETALLANYPNPFNPETWIPYQLAAPADVTLRIHAVDGSLVRTLSLGHKAVGIYQTRSRAAYWDGKNEVGEPVASGLYFYTLTAGDFTATQKMLIRK